MGRRCHPAGRRRLVIDESGSMRRWDGAAGDGRSDRVASAQVCCLAEPYGPVVQLQLSAVAAAQESRY